MATEGWLTVLTTTDAVDMAEALARGAVQARAAARAPIYGPVTSAYRWKGAVETAAEWQLPCRTTGARYDALEAYLREAHDCGTPETVATPVVRGRADHLRRLEEETVS